jgi:hypothetical protein
VVGGLECVFMRYLCVDSLNQQEVEYGSGAFVGKFLLFPNHTFELINCRNHIGEEVTDQVTISQNLVIANQSIGKAVRSRGFEGVDGILG